ncbi:putative membrane protein [Evansella vedderi]|uniref:Membrane protein n=1 Tax=Evansella vedderi TaxID=38282 RepID=A0ABT9ZQF9_9BACI|nr:small multi-drug export protein [Evansella vedderi]MDQ0253469.1 putative membrane protein [Evansella vedderi]
MDFIEFLWAYILVFLLSATPFLEACVVIPISIVAGLSPAPAIILGLVGNILTVLVVILFVNKIKEWRRRRKEGDVEKGESKRTKRAQNIWKKYGLPGLAIIGPMFVGSHLTAFMSISLGGTKKRTFYWMTISITLWTIVLTILAVLGIDLLGREDDGFLQNIFQ